jgi:Uma2 family endonuclease
VKARERKASMGTKTLLTFEQFEQLPPEEGKLFELDEGELIVMSTGRPRHNRVRDGLAYRLRRVVEEGGLGEIFIETDFRLSPNRVRIPDIAFLPAERAKRIDPDRIIEGAPALAIEVVSPTDLAADLARKVDQYLAAGAQAVWVLYPDLKEVHTRRPGGISATLTETDVLEAGDLLPGFSVRVRDLFE